MPILECMTRGEDVRAAARMPYRLLRRCRSWAAAALPTCSFRATTSTRSRRCCPTSRAVKCIYIDPPCDTRSAFEHYDDNLEHSQWLAMIYPHLVLLRELLAEDGSIWVSIDDNEGRWAAGDADHPRSHRPRSVPLRSFG